MIQRNVLEPEEGTDMNTETSNFNKRLREDKPENELNTDNHRLRKTNNYFKMQKSNVPNICFSGMHILITIPRYSILKASVWFLDRYFQKWVRYRSSKRGIKCLDSTAVF